MQLLALSLFLLITFLNDCYVVSTVLNSLPMFSPLILQSKSHFADKETMTSRD